MPYPTAPTNPIPTVASDANYNAPGDDWDGLPTKVAPTVAIQTQGYVPGDPRPADHDNYLFSTIAAWLDYLVDYDTELTAVKVTGPASATDNAIARFDGTGGKTVQNSGIQVTDGAEFAYTTPPTRTVLIPGAVLVTGTANSTTTTATATTLKTDNMLAYVDLAPYVPTDATITEIRLACLPGAARASNADRMAVRLIRMTGPATTSTQAEAFDDGTATAQSIVATTTLAVDRSGFRYVIEVEAGNDAGTNNDEARYLTVIFTDVGPRNF